MEERTLQPRYIQIKNYLIGKIESGEYKQNDKLPSERELSDRFGISRMTARNAILELVRDGYVYRNGAKGTFVTGKKVKRNFLHVGGFSTHMKESGVENFETKVLTAESLEADAWISNKLNINIGSTCYHFIRLRIGNEQPIAIDESYINGEYLPDLLQHDFSEESLWKILEQNKEHKPCRGRNAIELYHFDKRKCKLLELKNGTEGFRVLNFNYDKYGNVIEYSITYYRGDMFSFSYEVDIN